MKKNFTQAINRQALIAFTQQQKMVGNDIEKDKLWLEVMQADTQEDLMQNNTQAQEVLQWKIDCKLHNVEKAKALLLILLH